MKTTAWQELYAVSQQLGYCLLHSMWQITLVAVIVAVVLRLSRGCSPGMRHGIALLGLLSMAAWPVISFFNASPGITKVAGASETSAIQPSKSTAVLPANTPLPQNSVVSKSPLETPSVSSGAPLVSTAQWKSWRTLLRQCFPWAAAFWITGVIGLCLWRIGGWIKIQHLVKHDLAEIDPHWLAQVRELSHRYGIRRPVRLIASLKATVPFAVGLIRPLIVFPAQLLTGLPPAQVEALLAHELAHLRRHDFAINLIQLLIETLFFYHPAIWWINRVIRQEREFCCDDFVVAQSMDRRDYVRALARVAEEQFTSNPFATASNGGNLLTRLQRILSQPSPANYSRSVGILLLLLVAAVVGISHSRGAGPKGSQARGRILDRNGIVLAETTPEGIRKYPWGSLGSHLLGTHNLVGKSTGLEQTQDDVLKTGKDVTLELDVNFQLVVEDALRKAGIGRGAVTVLDPNTGAVLAMASVPNYDPNAFSGSIEEKRKGISQAAFGALMNDPTEPLLNRAINGYSSGSVFKIASAVAGVENRLGDRKFTCDGTVEIDGRKFYCWVVQKGMAGHGALDLSGSIKMSCNCYYYQLGLEMGSEKLFRTASLLGFNQKTGLEVPNESAGFIPSETRRSNPKDPWTKGMTANTIIGQGEVLATPLQLASMTATVGNRGTVWIPRLIAGPAQEKVDAHGIWTAEALEPIRKGMWQVVNETGGTGQKAKSQHLEIAGKTGTSQFYRKGIKDNHTWFIGFAPYQNPKYAISVLVQGGQAGGSTAAPIAKRILEIINSYEEKPPSPTPEPQPVIPGHFNLLEGVKY